MHAVALGDRRKRFAGSAALDRFGAQAERLPAFRKRKREASPDGAVKVAADSELDWRSGDFQATVTDKGVKGDWGIARTTHFAFDGESATIGTEQESLRRWLVAIRRRT
jgi:hypothetical protein